MWEPPAAAALKNLVMTMDLYPFFAGQQLTVSPDGKVLVVANGSNLYLYDLARLKDLNPNSGHREPVKERIFSGRQPAVADRQRQR